MYNIADNFNLTFFKADKYHYKSQHIFDTSNSPRPHFCIGLIIEGNANITDCASGEEIFCEKGDIIFVPINSTYISTWYGNPDISYISLHFTFNFPSAFSRQHNFKLQKIKLNNFDHTKDIFQYILNNYNGQNLNQLDVLSKFYEVLSYIYPQLKTVKTKSINENLTVAIEYIENNYTDNITVDDLARLSNMSTSRFFPCFKQSTGETPVDYINRFRISKSIIFMYDKNLSIEEISEKVGFKSSIYFRRVFKKITGKTPREYKKTSMEI